MSSPPAARFFADTVPTVEAIRLHQLVRRDGLPLTEVAKEYQVKPTRVWQIATMMDDIAGVLKANEGTAQGEHGQ